MACLDTETLQAFIDRQISPEISADVEAHARSCDTCRARLFVALAASSSPSSTLAVDLPATRRAAGPVGGTSIGRYTVLELVARGGMGAVYAAYDPELDRKVALKLLHAHSDQWRAQGRLLREAQITAKLSHPNVVSVFDVGTFDGRVFLAMEFVEGQTLAAWLKTEPRSPAEILHVFTAAGRGLSAAHRAGLVHRDFKPHNVMVGQDGTVRVTDFGVAGQIGDAAREEGFRAAATGASDEDSSLRDVTLTRTGELVGTPLFMAPEQFKAPSTDARSDQFSFCVALYWALYGVYPFGDKGFARMVGDFSGGQVGPAPNKTNVPLRLRKILLRGLSVDREARWPSMDDLLAALAHDPAARRRALWLGGGLALAGALAVVIGGAVRTPRQGVPLCHGGPARLDGVWEPDGAQAGTARRRESVKGALFAAGVPGASEVWQRLAAILDRYSAAWLATYTDACEATHMRGEQSSEILDLRMACLDDRRSALESLTQVLSAPSAEVAKRAIDAASSLPPVGRCRNVALLRMAEDAPLDAATRARVDQLRQRGAHAVTLANTNQSRAAIEESRGLVAEARKLGYRPLVAELLLVLGKARSESSVDEAVLEEAVWTAVSVKRDEVAAEAAENLINITGYKLARYDEGKRWATIALSLIDRLSTGQDLLRSWVLQDLAIIHEQEGDLKGALGLIREATGLKKKAGANDGDVALAFIVEGEILHHMGNAPGALSLADANIPILVRVYGPNNRHVAEAMNNRGEYLVALGRPEEAVRDFRAALAAFESDLGPENHCLAYPLTGIGQAELASGRPAAAVGPLERALHIRETSEPVKTTLAETRFALARALWATGGDRARAVALATRAHDDIAGTPTGDVAGRTVATWLAAHPAR